jgi:hypothetical protein
MLGTYTYHEIIKKTVVGFGTLFNNIQIRRTSNNKTEVMKVPLAYGPAEKFLARLRQTPDPTQSKIQITLPRLSFEITSIKYDGDRKVAPTQQIKYKNPEAQDGMYTSYMPVPYNIGFTLSIISKNQDDGLQILEQILPYFQPSYNLTIEMIPEIGEIKDIIINLDDVSYDDDYDGELDKRRSLVYNLTFTAKSYLYGPVREPSVIRKSIVDTYSSIDTVEAPRVQRYTVQPDPSDADADDDFGFNEVFSEFTDAQKWNPATGEDEPV